MKNFRYGHCKDIFVKVGDKVKKGDKIATIGTGNGQWSAHLHLDMKNEAFNNPAGYVFGWTKEEVEKIFPDPTKYIKTVLPEFDHYGWKYLELADYSGKKCYHPGVDLNGKGAGNADLGDPIYSACDGKVVFCYNGPDHNGGWGKLLIIEEIQAQKEPESVPVEIYVATPTPEASPASISEATGPSETPANVPHETIPEIPKNDNFLIILIKNLWTKLSNRFWRSQ